MVKVHVFNGSPARIVPSEDALTALADMLGHPVKTLRVKGQWVSHWSYRCAGEVVGRIEAV